MRYRTRRDLERLAIELTEGMRIRVYDEDSLDLVTRDDLIAEVEAVWEPIEGHWTLAVVEGTLHHESEVLLDRAAAEAEAYGG